MPAPNLATAEAALAATIEPLRELMAAIENEIHQRETELVDLRKRRTETGRALTILDPQWAADHRKSAKTKTHGASPARLEEIFAGLGSFNGDTFNAKQVAERTSIHVTTVNRVLKMLHDQGRIQLDHMGGPRRMSKFFRVTPTSEGGNDGN